MLEATYLTLTSNVALAAVQEASLNAQVEETQKAINAEELLISGETYAQSFDSASARDWAALRSAKAQAEQTMPLLQKQLAAQHDLLNALTGEFAGAGVRARVTSRLQLPMELPLVLSSQLVEQRPDVRAAQANLHAASALVGVAIANRIPLFNITGNIGKTSGQFDNLANSAPQFLFWTFAGSVTQTVFDGFTLEQRQRAAEAGLEQAMEQYKSTVVTSFQNVADVLQAIVLDGRSVKKAWEATEAAKENLCLTVAGFVGYSGKDDAGSVEDLKYVDDKQDGKQGIADAFGRWWKDVCRTRPDFENYLKKRLSREAARRWEYPERNRRRHVRAALSVHPVDSGDSKSNPIHGRGGLSPGARWRLVESSRRRGGGSARYGSSCAAPAPTTLEECKA
jgi:Outer membrane efflux protein